MMIMPKERQKVSGEEGMVPHICALAHATPCLVRTEEPMQILQLQDTRLLAVRGREEVFPTG